MTLFSSLYGSYLDEELGTDDNSILFTTVRRKSAINKGAAKFAALTECLVRRVTFPITGGTAEYDLNSTLVIPAADFDDLAKDGIEFQYTDASSNVTYVADDSLPRRDIDWLNQNEPGWRLSTVASSVMQLPRYYYRRIDSPRNLLGFTPTPSTGSSASAAVLLPYVAVAPTMVNDTEEPYTFNSSVRIDLRGYHQALVHYATYQLEKLRKDTQASQGQLSLFMGFVAQYLQDNRIKGGRQIRQARSYFGRHRSAGSACNVWTGR